MVKQGIFVVCGVLQVIKPRCLWKLNGAQFLVSRLNSFPRVGVAKAECHTRSRISQVPYLLTDYCSVIPLQQLLTMPVPENFVMANCC